MLIYKGNNLKGSKIMTKYTYIYSDYDINSNGKAAISVNDTVKILIPRKFGGGFIKAKYIGYGFFELKNGKFICSLRSLGHWKIPERQQPLFQSH